jgi:hypothetical protein
MVRHPSVITRLDIPNGASGVPIRKFDAISVRLLSQCLRENLAPIGRNVVTKITKRVVDAAEVQEKDYVIWDDELPGFGLRVFASGKRS